MNLDLYKKLMTTGDSSVRKCGPRQRWDIWKTFLQICEVFLKENEVENPVVVELGVYRNHQKKFYEQLLNAEHIGIDISDSRGIPDILGNTHDSETLAVLKKRLEGRSIDILFIDAAHSYADVKQDFDMYSPLCDGIIALDDINLSRHRVKKRKSHGVWQFWDELKMAEGYDEYIFLSICQEKDCSGMGVIIQK